MSHATCTQCGTVQQWSAFRGSRLSDYRCAACGGELRAYRDPAHAPAKRRPPIRIPKKHQAERWWYRIGAMRARNGKPFIIDELPWPMYTERPRTDAARAAYEAGYRKFSTEAGA